jgi:hypothetical protein
VSLARTLLLNASSVTNNSHADIAQGDTHLHNVCIQTESKLRIFNLKWLDTDLYCRDLYGRRESSNPTTMVTDSVPVKTALDSRQQRALDREGATLSIATVNQFDTAASYQQMLSSMVSQLQYFDSFSDSQIGRETVSFKYSSNSFWDDGFVDGENQWQLQQSTAKRSSSSLHYLAISSVDPLHFLGITPTVQSAELLHACQLALGPQYESCLRFQLSK